MRPYTLSALAAALLGVTVALSACGSTVDVAGAASGAGGGSSSAASVGAVGSSSVGSGGFAGDPGATSVSSSAGNGGSPLDGGPPPPFDSGPPPPFDSGLMCAGLGDACTACLSSSCAGDWCDCRASSDCVALLACTGTCGANDPTCTQACVTAHANGISPAELLGGCAAAQCPQACPGNAPLSTCNQCLFGACPSQMDACVANAECSAYFNCTKACNGSSTCIATCQSMYPAGLVDASEVNACAATDCLVACN